MFVNLKSLGFFIPNIMHSVRCQCKSLAKYSVCWYFILIWSNRLIEGACVVFNFFCSIVYISKNRTKTCQSFYKTMECISVRIKLNCGNSTDNVLKQEKNRCKRKMHSRKSEIISTLRIKELEGIGSFKVMVVHWIACSLN